MSVNGTACTGGEAAELLAGRWRYSRLCWQAAAIGQVEYERGEVFQRCRIDCVAGAPGMAGRRDQIHRLVLETGKCQAQWRNITIITGAIVVVGLIIGIGGNGKSASISFSNC